MGRIGPEPEDGKSMRLLNRVIEWRDDGINLEADQRHAEIIIKELGLLDANGSDVPGPKEKRMRRTTRSWTQEKRRCIGV